MGFIRSDAVLIQQASHEWKPLLYAVMPHHAAYCDRHNMDYWAIAGLTTEAGADGQWEKVCLIERAIASGYEYILWLDCDTLIVTEENLRAACPENALGCVWHSVGHLPGCYDHFNNGAIYLHRGPRSEAFVRAWRQTSDGGHHWGNQHAMNLAYNAWDETDDPIVEIDPRWNAIPGASENPAVLAWHGCGEAWQRLQQMEMRLALEGSR